MKIYQDIETVWINTSHGVTVYFHYNHLAGNMSGHVITSWRVSQTQIFGSCKSIVDGRNQIAKLTQKDADSLFATILKWDINKHYVFENYLVESYKRPIRSSTKK
jgi:hypothetical protein